MTPEEPKINFLLHWIWRVDTARQLFEEQWLGRKVRLKTAVTNHREQKGFQTYVKEGTVGTIVGIRFNATAPFEVEFQGVPWHVVPLLEKLDLDPLDKVESTV